VIVDEIRASMVTPEERAMLLERRVMTTAVRRVDVPFTDQRLSVIATHEGRSGRTLAARLAVELIAARERIRGLERS